MTADWSQDLFERPVDELPVLGHPVAWWQERGRRRTVAADLPAARAPLVEVGRGFRPIGFAARSEP